MCIVMAALKTIRSSFEIIANDLETFLCYNEVDGTRILSLLQRTFDFNKKDESLSGRVVDGCPLDKLEIEEFDLEQLWQQIQLQNDSLLTQSSHKLDQLLKKQTGIRLNDNKLEMEEDCEKLVNTVKRSEAICEDELEDGDIVDYGFSTNDRGHRNLSDDVRPERKSKSNNTIKRSVVDDEFFKLAEMEKFLEMEEKREEANGRYGHNNDDNDSVDDVDLFTDYNNVYEEGKETGIELDESIHTISELAERKFDIKKMDAANYMYKDFFNDADEESDPNEDVSEDDQAISYANQGSVKDKTKDGDNDFVESDISEVETELSGQTNNNPIKSTFQKQQDKVKRKIAELEDSNVSSKPWQLSGEAPASVRPTNSLLEEMIHFDHTTAPAPDITEETSQLLEDIIKQRVKDQTWDDVERKEKPVKEPYEYKKARPLNQEKSTMSLSEIYEKEYLKQKEPVAEKENEEHTEIQKMMNCLFSKLDALSNFHFTPKPPQYEVTIVANVPSIAIEETAPINVSETTLLAPEEVYDKQKVEMKGTSELTKTDRKHERRVKKKRKRLAAKNKEKVGKVVEKMKPGLGNKYSKAKVVEKLKRGEEKTALTETNQEKRSLSSSSAFFAKLQDSVREQIQEKKNVANNNSKRVLSTQVKL